MPAHATTRCSIRHSLFLVQRGNKHEELETVVIANLQCATCLRQSILQKAVTGELTPTE